MDNLFAYDELLYALYSDEPVPEKEKNLLGQLIKLIPSDYSSLLIPGSPEKGQDKLEIAEILCEPENFLEAEKKYTDVCRDELPRRLALTGESSVVRQSSVQPEYERLHSKAYLKCYEPFGIYDVLQLSVRSRGELLAVVSLFRTRKSGVFADDDVYLMKALGRHFARVFGRRGELSAVHPSADGMVSAVSKRVYLTPREKEILSLVFSARTNDEICEKLHIKEHTMQKHFQNIYRKLNVSSRWELLRTAVDLYRGSEGGLPDSDKL